MIKRISLILLTTITGMFVVIALCWPGMHQIKSDCADSHTSRASFFSVPESPCVALHFEGISMFNRVIISMASWTLLFWTLIVFFIVQYTPFLFQKNKLTLFIHDSPLYIPKKHYRWLAKHFSLYHLQYS